MKRCSFRFSGRCITRSLNVLRGATVSTIGTVVKKSGVDASEIGGVGLSGQMHGLVMLDEDSNAIRKSIIWCDQHTAA